MNGYPPQPSRLFTVSMRHSAMKQALFLGAGASAFAGLPDTAGLLEKVRIRVREWGKESDRIGTPLQKHINRFIEDKLYDNDIEKLYDGVRRVIDTGVDNCQPITASISVDGDFNHKTLVDELTKLLDIIRRTMLDEFRVDNGVVDDVGHVFGTVQTVMGRDQDEFLVFTTNYDMLLETYADGQNLEVVNGFSDGGHLQKIWTDDWVGQTDRRLHLTKLHGSINWHVGSDGRIVETGGIQERDSDHDIMIAPTEGPKDYNREPFTALMQHFDAELKNVGVLWAIGSSFRDEMIADIIKKRLAEGMVLVSVSPTAARDIRRLSDAEPEPADAESDLQTVGQNIILCEQNFEKNNPLYQSLAEAHDMAKDILERDLGLLKL